jgi:bifunctional non-homologous end joining protein LigD
MAAKRRGLDAYRSKRKAGRTPEPFGSSSGGKGGQGAKGGKGGKAGSSSIFVVQLHQARRRHYDFRLQIGDVLVSWAVPKGPSMDPGQKRIAIHVEDHPLDYADFEGIIPADNYGAGPVIVWDRGRVEFIEGDKHGLEHGKLLFELYGYKLRGRFTLVQTKKNREPTSEWLLIKKSDGFANADALLSDASIDSGLVVEELEGIEERIEERRAILESEGLRRHRLNEKNIKPMLCEPIESAFSDSEWFFELKYDGYRLIAGRDEDSTFLRYRRGPDATKLYPEVARALSRLPVSRCVLDGEIVIFDESGRSDFGRLQRRASLSGRRDIENAMRNLPATYVVFDVLELEGFDPCGAARSSPKNSYPPRDRSSTVNISRRGGKTSLPRSSDWTLRGSWPSEPIPRMSAAAVLIGASCGGPLRMTLWW